MIDLRRAIGLGVAGNFAGHLEQAGEASDFVAVKTADATAPKGVFPFYVPDASGHFLGTFPLSHDVIARPSGADHLQIEPEVGLVCELAYRDGRVAGITPVAFAAHDDCSIRRPGAKKISEKKNWGADSKGTARQQIAIDDFGPGGVLDRYRLASFLERDGALHEYGVDSEVSSYSYFGPRLIDWLVDRCNEQRDEGPLEDIAAWIERAGHPAHALISIGATRYTEFGETTYLAEGDRAIVAVYDGSRWDAEALRELVVSDDAEEAEGASILRQTVV